MCLFEPRTAIRKKARSVEFILILKSYSTCGVGYGSLRVAR
ncbi:conserved hypothetical protein [Leptospira interrogans serovar Manilae]|uniref:Uncharacterized protein n=1 Tax=Leptospira interrogans serovar Manilae TaxID=214675 RepID=A0AAQ1NY34_LEPIR|nr:conserved hypothetical protein [Leptospira interrogans serovar Manilae]